MEAKKPCFQALLARDTKNTLWHSQSTRIHHRIWNFGLLILLVLKDHWRSMWNWSAIGGLNALRELVEHIDVAPASAHHWSVRWTHSLHIIPHGWPELKGLDAQSLQHTVETKGEFGRNAWLPTFRKEEKLPKCLNLKDKQAFCASSNQDAFENPLEFPFWLKNCIQRDVPLRA